MLCNPTLKGIYNAGFENMRITEIAQIVSRKTGARIKFEESNDPRSYRIDSTKLLATGFRPTKTIHNAIEEVINALKNKEVDLGDFNSNVNWMRHLISEGKINVEFN